MSLVLHEFHKTGNDTLRVSALCSLTHCHYLTLERDMKPNNIRLLTCGSLGQLRCFSLFLSTSREESPLEQCVMREHHLFLLQEEASHYDTQNFFS